MYELLVYTFATLGIIFVAALGVLFGYLFNSLTRSGHSKPIPPRTSRR